MFLFIDVVNNNGIVPLHHFCIFNALINLSMALQNLEDSFFIDVIFVVLQKVSEIFHFSSMNVIKFFFIFGTHLFAFFFRQNIVNFIQFQFNYPSTKKKFLWTALHLVTLLQDDIKDCLKIPDQICVLILIDKFKSHFFERFGRLCVEFRGFFVFFLGEFLVSVDS
jgi:hypothetical protein